MILTTKKRKIRTIAFIEPRNEHLHINNHFELSRLGSLLLATIMRDLGYDTRAYFLTDKEIRARKITADLVCITSIAPTALTAYDLAIHYQGIGIPVVMGGSHVSVLPEEAIQYSNYVIVGEGEKSLPKLVEGIQGLCDLDEIPGLYWKIGTTITKNIPNTHIECLDDNPVPDWSLMELGKNRKWKRKERRYLRRIQMDEDSYEDNIPWDGWPIFSN